MILQIGKDDWGIKQYGEIKKPAQAGFFIHRDLCTRGTREKKEIKFD